MKILPFLFFMLFCSAQHVQCQNSEHINAHVFQLGYGFSNREKETFLENSPGELSMDDMYLNPIESQYSSESSGFGPLYLRYEYRSKKYFGFGFMLAYCDYTASTTRNYTRESFTSLGVLPYYKKISQTSKNLSLALRGDGHLIQNKWIDIYIGLAAGYNHNPVRTVIDSNDPVYSARNPYINEVLIDPGYLAASLGIRYYPTRLLGIYAELGFDRWTYFQAGLVIKL